MDIAKLAEKLVMNAQCLGTTRIINCEQMAGDASGRQYYRLFLDSSVTNSAILMVLSGGTSPVGGGARNLSQDDCFVEVRHLLHANSIRVPAIYLDGRDRGALLLEDVGSKTLLGVSQDPNLSHAQIGSYYQKATDLLVALQRINPCADNIICERTTTGEQRQNQIQEFLDYYAVPRGLSLLVAKRVRDFMLDVCQRIELHPRVVSHFDFMPANIHVIPSSELCLIDFQDACLDSPARDLYSILNDRGSDSVLGPLEQARLFRHYLDQTGRGSEFINLYDEFALHWDFRVSGRFAFLSDQKGLKRYQQWIPSTLKRLGRTLARYDHPQCKEILNMLSDFSPEIKQGAADPWNMKSVQ